MTNAQSCKRYTSVIYASRVMSDDKCRLYIYDTRNVNYNNIDYKTDNTNRHFSILARPPKTIFPNSSCNRPSMILATSTWLPKPISSRVSQPRSIQLISSSARICCLANCATTNHLPKISFVY